MLPAWSSLTFRRVLYLLRLTQTFPWKKGHPFYVKTPTSALPRRNFRELFTTVGFFPLSPLSQPRKETPESVPVSPPPPSFPSMKRFMTNGFPAAPLTPLRLKQEGSPALHNPHSWIQYGWLLVAVPWSVALMINQVPSFRSHSHANCLGLLMEMVHTTSNEIESTAFDI